MVFFYHQRLSSLETEPSHILEEGLALMPFFLMGSASEIALNAVFISFLLVCSGLLSGSEVAFFSLSHQDRGTLIEEQSNASKRIMTLLETPKYLLSTILITNNIVNIAIILVSNSLLQLLLPDNLSSILNFIITTVLVTFLLVLFGEVAPKVYAKENNMKIARLMSGPLSLFRWFCKPISWVLVNSTDLVEQRLRDRINQRTITQEDIASAIELSVRDDKYAEQDVDMLKGIIRFGNTSAAEVMKPRMKVVALDVETSFDGVLQIFKEKSYSRIPIYKDDLDQIEGIIHAKDLLEHLHKVHFPEWRTLMRPPLVVPEHKKIDALFGDFQEKRTHMAIVVDEYGGTQGIVTMEDVLEQIVGDIQDEFDETEDQEMTYHQIDDYTYEFSGSMPIGEICRVLDLRSDEFDDVREGAETIAGLVLVLHGELPRVNAQVCCKGYDLVIQKATKRRIDTVRMTLPQINDLDETSEANHA